MSDEHLRKLFEKENPILDHEMVVTITGKEVYVSKAVEAKFQGFCQGIKFANKPEPKEQPFWLVWNPKNDRTPRFRHISEESAINEAKRLSNMGDEFYVLQVIGKATKEKRTGGYQIIDNIPF